MAERTTATSHRPRGRRPSFGDLPAAADLRAEIYERVRVILDLELRGGVEGDVVIDELPEVRVGRR